MSAQNDTQPDSELLEVPHDTDTLDTRGDDDPRSLYSGISIIDFAPLSDPNKSKAPLVFKSTLAEKAWLRANNVVFYAREVDDGVKQPIDELSTFQKSEQEVPSVNSLEDTVSAIWKSVHDQLECSAFLNFRIAGLRDHANATLEGQIRRSDKPFASMSWQTVRDYVEGRDSKIQLDVPLRADTEPIIDQVKEFVLATQRPSLLNNLLTAEPQDEVERLAKTWLKSGESKAKSFVEQMGLSQRDRLDSELLPMPVIALTLHDVLTREKEEREKRGMERRGSAWDRLSDDSDEGAEEGGWSSKRS